MAHVIAYDVGTTGLKTCLFAIGKDITLLASANRGYGLTLLPDGGAEQDAFEWWAAMAATTKELFAKTSVLPSEVDGISFCSQMQGLVLVDEKGTPVRPPMSYMDQRAREEFRKGMGFGLKVAGCNLFRLLRCLRITKAAPTSVKDPLWRYLWVRNHEPEAFAKIYRWLDVKEFLISRCTGEFVMTPDSAYSTFLYDTRKGKEGWSLPLCRTFGVDPKHLPRIVRPADRVGGLTDRAASDLGLLPGTAVFGGGGDATLIAIGAGCVNPGETHVYCGTSGWVSTVLDRQVVDTDAMIASVLGAETGRYNYFAEMETAGKCLEWVKDHLALDEIGIYLEKKHVAESREAVYASLYDYMTETVKNVEPGAGGVVFTPWLHGNRCPFEDFRAAGIFFNIRLETGKTEMIRAVLEGVCYHLRWMLECQDRRIRTSSVLRFVGGGALSAVTAQILSDVTGRQVEVIANPQNVGALGAAAVAGVGLGEIPGLVRVRSYLPIIGTFSPDPGKKSVYDRQFGVFKKLHAANQPLFETLNA